MIALVVLGLLASCQAAPQLLVAQPYINSGSASGPLTAAFGDLVSTNRGLRPVSLEGFSEDLNEDGFVDPIGQAVAPPVVAAAPVVYTAAAPAVAVEAKTAPLPLTYAAAPVVQYAAAPVVQYAAAPAVYHTIQTIPQVTVQRQILTHTTHQVINHAPLISGFPLLAAPGLPVVAAAPAAPEAAPVEQA